MQTTTAKKIVYPYMPAGKTIGTVPETNPFMSEAKKLSQEMGCLNHPTASVIVKDDRVVARGVNSKTKRAYCARTLAGCKTGEGYELCPECFHNGHSEVTAIKDARSHGIDAQDADLYLYGHWWSCKNCWDAMIEAGIRNVFVIEGAREKFAYSDIICKVYVSGAMTAMERPLELRKIYEKIAKQCETFCTQIYVPHLAGNDPLDNFGNPTDSLNFSPWSAEFIWKKDHRELVSSDLMIAYIGQPSLGVGSELEIARANNTDIIAWWFKGERVSRMARGNPGIKHTIEARDENDLFIKLEKILDDLRE